MVPMPCLSPQHTQTHSPYSERTNVTVCLTAVMGRRPDINHSRLPQVQLVTHLEKPPPISCFQSAPLPLRLWSREALAGSASSSAGLSLSFPRLSPYLCCWALGSQCDTRPRKSVCLGSKPAPAVHQAPREQANRPMFARLKAE